MLVAAIFSVYKTKYVIDPRWDKPVASWITPGFLLSESFSRITTHVTKTIR